MNKNRQNYSQSDNKLCEIEKIRERYLPKTEYEEKLEELNRLDRKVRLTPLIIAITIGVISTLIFGVGLCCVLEWNLIVWGVIIALVACVPLSLTYTLFWSVSEKLRTKYSEQILKLTEELLSLEKK